MLQDGPSIVHAGSQVEQAEIQRVALHGPFEMDNGTSSPTVLTAAAGWTMRIDRAFLIAELRGEVHFIPLENIAGIRPAAAPAHPARKPDSDQGSSTQRDMKPASTGKRRAGGNAAAR